MKATDSSVTEAEIVGEREAGRKSPTKWDPESKARFFRKARSKG